MLKARLQADLKSAMLSRDSQLCELIRGLKSAILYAEVATGKRGEGLGEEEIVVVLKKESKKRQEAADLYVRGGNQAAADKELSEKVVIDGYLPQQLSEAKLDELIDASLEQLGLSELDQKDMGKVIGAVKAVGGSAVDGGTLARLVQKRVQK